MLSATQRELETRGSSAILAELRIFLNEKVLKTEDDPFQYLKIKKDLYSNLSKLHNRRWACLELPLPVRECGVSAVTL